MGGPAFNPIRQRSCRGLSSHESASGCPSWSLREATARASALFWPSGVRGGSRPSAGSTISDVRFVLVTLFPRSYQSSLYGTTPPGGHCEPPCLGSIKSRFWRRFSSCSYFAASSVVKNAFVPSSLDRSSGVIVRKSQTPCRSGWPSGVRGGLYEFWPKAAVQMSTNNAVFILTPPNQFFHKPRCAFIKLYTIQIVVDGRDVELGPGT